MTASFWVGLCSSLCNVTTETLLQEQEPASFFLIFFIKHIAAKDCLTNMVLWVIMRALQIIFTFNFYNIIATMNKVLNYLSTMSGSFLFPNML